MSNQQIVAQIKVLLLKINNPQHVPHCIYGKSVPINECPTKGCYDIEKWSKEAYELLEKLK